MLTVEMAPLNTPRIVGFDTIAKLDADAAGRLAAEGLRFAVRYIGLTAPRVVDLDAAEVEALTSSGLGVMCVQYARTGGWSAETGRVDGDNAARNARAAGLPPETTLWCDLEGALPGSDVAIAYGAAWCEGASSAGWGELGVYVGAGLAPPLTEGQLFHALPFRRYWRSLSQVSNVAVRGYQLLQLFPDDQVVAGVRVDLDVVQSDYLGSRVSWAVQA